MKEQLKDWQKEAIKKAEESKNHTFDNWIEDLEGKEQPELCNINDEDCENCGS